MYFIKFMPHKVIIAGATGLVGNLLLELMLHHPDISEVLVLSRKQLPLQNQKLKQLIIDFDRLEDYQAEINGDAVFCCLGTTRKKTPDLKEYRKIDHDYPVALAKTAAKNSIAQFHFISSLGANPNSFAFYTKIKGETERDIKAIQIPSIYIYQPAFLVGNRKEKRFGERFGMKLFQLINVFLVGRLKKYRSIPAEVVAKAMINQFLNNNTGTFTYPSDQIKKLA